MGVRERGVSAEQAVAYRVAAHNLHQLLPADGLLDAAGVVGVQDTPPGNAGVALANRVAKLTPDDLEGALHDERTLVRILSHARRGPRGAPPRRHGVRPGRPGGGGGVAARAARGVVAGDRGGRLVGPRGAGLGHRRAHRGAGRRRAAHQGPAQRGAARPAAHRARAVVRRVRRPPRARPAAAAGRHRRCVRLRLAPRQPPDADGHRHLARRAAGRRRPRGPARAGPPVRPRLRARVAAAPGRLDGDERRPRPATASPPWATS